MFVYSYEVDSVIGRTSREVNHMTSGNNSFLVESASRPEWMEEVLTLEFKSPIQHITTRMEKNVFLRRRRLGPTSQTSSEWWYKEKI